MILTIDLECSPKTDPGVKRVLNAARLTHKHWHGWHSRGTRRESNGYSALVSSSSTTNKSDTLQRNPGSRFSPLSSSVSCNLVTEPSARWPRTS